MAMATGEIEVGHDGKLYRLRLTFGVLARLQERYGHESMARMFGAEDGVPNFGACIALVELALQRHHPEADAQLADDMVTADPDIIRRLQEAAFPDPEAQPGKSQAAGTPAQA